MDQLTGPEVQVVLSLKEGRGFDKINNPTCIVATLNGLSLETDFIDPEPCPQYMISLVWEANKCILRKMRSAQDPLKIEFFEYRENGTKDKLGYFLLSLRSAQILPRGYEGGIKTTWLKLMGARSDIKADKPEFLLSLTIGERESISIGLESERKDEQILPTDLPTPYLINEECLIQLGSINECRDIFTFSIITETVANLDCLKDKPSKADTDKSFTLWYHVFDTQIQSKPFVNSQQSFSLEEKIVIRVRSSLRVFKNYLQHKPYLMTLLKHRDTVLGQSEVDLRSLVPTDNIEEFLRNSDNGCTVLYEHCLLKTLDNKDQTFNIEDKPSVNIQLKLQYLGSKSTSSQNYLTEIYKRASCFTDHTVQKSSDIECHRHPAGDYHKCSCEIHNINSCINKPDRYPSADLAQRRLEHTHMCNKKDSGKNVGAYHCYCLHIMLNSIKLRSGMSIDNIEFRFHHPKAEIMSTVYPKMPALSGDELRLHDIGCKLHFISASEEIRHLLLSFPPKVSVCDGDKPEKTCIGQSVLDVCRLFDNQVALDCQYEAPLFEFDNALNEIGFINVSMYLEDHGPYYQTNKRSRNENLGPPILDDSLAYKIVDELESWKVRQQEIFKLELKRKEERHLNRLSEQWQRHRESLEAKLNESVEQCKILANQLSSVSDDLRARKLQSLDKEARLIKANEELKFAYDKKLEEFKDNSQTAQQDLKLKLTQLEDQKQSLIVQVELMRVENAKLEDILKKQNEELSACKKSPLMQDQIENLIQDLKDFERKLNSAQKSKSFFKEQWGKAVREIHKMKMEHRQAIEVQIKNNKEELKNINLEEILHADSAALNNDKILLGQIQKEIDVIKPKCSYTLLSPEKSFPSTFNSRLQTNLNNGHSAVSTAQYEQARKLIEERDALLKTKSYTTDDDIIVKLNTEIRSLLVNR